MPATNCRGDAVNVGIETFSPSPSYVMSLQEAWFGLEPRGIATAAGLAGLAGLAAGIPGAGALTPKNAGGCWAYPTPQTGKPN